MRLVYLKSVAPSKFTMVVFMIVGTSKSDPLYELDFTAPTPTTPTMLTGLGGGGGGQTQTQTGQTSLPVPVPVASSGSTGASADMPTLDMSYLHQFILHSSLDMAHNTMWTNPAS